MILGQAEAITAWRPLSMTDALMSAAIFGLLGVVTLFIGYKVFDILMPKIDVEKELADRNMAVAIMMASVMLSIAYIIGKAISG